LSSAETRDPKGILHTIDSDSNNILSLKNLPLYQFVRKTIRDITIPEIHRTDLQGLLSRFDAAMAELDAAAQLDRDAKVQSEILSTNILYETQSEILDLLLNRVAEIDSEGRLDPNIAYVDIATDSGVRNPLPFKEKILEMYFIMAERKRWDIFVVSHREKETCVRLKGKSVYPLMRSETGVHEWRSGSSIWNVPSLVKIVVRPHFKSKFLPEVRTEDVSSPIVTPPTVDVEHIESKLKAQSAEHSTVVRNHAEAIFSLRQKMAAETWFAGKELSLPNSKTSHSQTQGNGGILIDRYVAPSLFNRTAVVRSVDSVQSMVFDKRISDQSSSTNSESKNGENELNSTSPELDSQLMPFPTTKGDHGKALLSPDDLSFIQERLLMAYRRSLLQDRVRQSYLEDNTKEVFDLCRLYHRGGDGSSGGEVILSEDGESSLLRSKCEELDRVKERRAALEEMVKTTRDELEAKCRECEQLTEKLKEQQAFAEKLAKGKRDVSEVIKEEAVSWMKKEESAKESFFKSWRRKESSLEDLIDKRYSDRMDLSQDKIHLQSQLDRALSLIEKQQKDLKESGARVSVLTVQVGDLKNVLENKDRQLADKDGVLSSFRPKADKQQLLEQLETAEAEVARRLAEVKNVQVLIDGEKLKVERLTTELNELEGTTRAASERDEAKINFLNMTIENFQTTLVKKEMENKIGLEKERANVESMRRQMTDYIKKHAQNSMDKEMTVLKLEKEVETLKKEVEMSGKREEALQVALNRERSGRDHASYMQEEEKRAWMDEWERTKGEEIQRQQHLQQQWQSAEKNLRERLRQLESENKEAKDTIENLIAFQQRKNRDL